MVQALVHKIFGSPNDRIIKGYRKRIDAINALEPELQALSDTQLAAQTDKLRGLVKGGKTLDDILPEAFATVREVSRRTMGQRHFDVQLMGGIALHEGYIPEMRTGEGKTLTATLAVYLNALEGKGVHVVTVNDYLAQRDANWMSPIYKTLGMSVGFILSNLPDEIRRQSYAADITYGTNNEFGFDYLRDNMKFRLEDMVQRAFNYAIVDEVDSILVDEARTPLIISGQIQDSAEMYRVIDKVIPQLLAPKGFVQDKPAGLNIGRRVVEKEDDADYEIDLKHKTVVLTDRGNEHVEQILKSMGALTEGGLYDAQNISLVHHINQALRAHKLFSRDVDYIVKDGGVIIIDEFTGRMMDGRRFSEGLHQALEAKEDVKVQNENQVLASITFQNYFRMYPKLAGMTGTALTEKDEFEAIYNLSVVEIPTNKSMVREDHHDEIYRTVEEKYEAIIKVVQECSARNQPILVGTTSIEKSEMLSQRLKKAGIKHNVLNARYHEQEAFIIAQAGKLGAVTIATNMAGRGTDIKLGGNVEMQVAQEAGSADPGQLEEIKRRIHAEVEKSYSDVIAAGGLYVVGSERHESRRIDNQLRGRSGRQGDPGASKFFISLEDDLMRIFGSDTMDKFLQKMGIKRGQAIVHPWINTAIERAQKKVEAQHFEIRKQLLKFDNVMNDQRKVVYEQRREVMNSQDVSEFVTDFRHDVIHQMVAAAIPHGTYAEQWDMQLLKTDALRFLGLHIPADDWAKEEGVDDQKVIERIIKLSDEKLAAKEQAVSSAVMRQVEKHFLLQILDTTWKEHLLNLDYLRQGISLRQYGQRDPLNEYKAEAFAEFQNMLAILRERVTTALCLIELHSDVPPPLPRQRSPEKTVESRGFEPPPAAEPPTLTPVTGPDFNQNDPTTWTKTPRNAPCPCGSNKKYKYCHGQSAS